ncbi:GGDEF domain-containing protein [Desulfovibrio sp. JC022]|uniref:GGDEF domain-containing protein n=1 Tax=Desulfovibrio sp. JC022 TaxID=2593642 RepID=UPI0013D3F78A|nr:GGDEF domain-containing protein [Desulfovibrio sp. JC022]NDV23981.1 GGDEF domain-containing protein [Desulfovibrio sp. JC022]
MIIYIKNKLKNTGNLHRRPNSRNKLRAKSFIAVLLILILPAGAMMAAAEFADRDSLAMYICLHFSLCIALCMPIANWLENWMVNREVQKMNSFCVKLKQGKLNQRLELYSNKSAASTDELCLLQHNLNWLAHSVAKRESKFTESLAKTRKDKERLNLLSYTDHLTGLFNKRFFELKLVEACSRCISCKTPLHLMLIDCDHFKEVNDIYGHQEGDRILAELGRIISSSVRGGTDFPFRFGGDEFGAILVGVDSTRCEQIAERIRDRFAQIKLGRASLSIGISKLCYQAMDPETEAEQLVAAADKALYFAKNTGRDKIISPAQYKESPQPCDP